jgi:hypothetical protein
MFEPKAAKAELAAVPLLAACLAIALNGTALAASGPLAEDGPLATALDGIPLADGGDLVTTAAQTTCAAPLIEQPFVSFDDGRDYTLAPGADFEDPSAPGWQLRRGAAIVEGNEPFQVSGKDDGASLALPAGASATSPPMCVDETYPSFRFFARLAQRGPALAVKVIYSAPSGLEATPAATLPRASQPSWFLTDDVPLAAPTSAAVPGGRLVALHFAVKGGRGSWQIDDVYVDPRCH